MSKESNEHMNGQILAAAGREPGDGPKEKKASGMSRILLEAMPKSIKLFQESDN